MNTYVLCSRCFLDQGLRLYAESIGVNNVNVCTSCGASEGRKLCIDQAKRLAHSFFVLGSFEDTDYGGAPVIQFNEDQKTSIDLPVSLLKDAARFSDAVGIGFFYYGPKLWMLGHIEPLKKLGHRRKRKEVIKRICTQYPSKTIGSTDLFYRIRKNPLSPNDYREYDSPPKHFCGNGRLDTKRLPILYGSQDLIICIHECRIAASDRIFVATLAPKRDLRLLDLTQIMDDGKNEFESLDLAINFLFLARDNSYSVSRYVAYEIMKAGFDGLIYPSFFSLLRTGKVAFETVFGISTRRIEEFREAEQQKTIPNLALFGRPIDKGKVEIRCVNRLFLEKVDYHVRFGPMLE